MTTHEDRRARYLHGIVHKPRIALVLTGACVIAWYSALSEWTISAVLLVLALIAYPHVLGRLMHVLPISRVPLAGLTPDWIAAGCAVATTGFAPALVLAFSMTAVIPAVMLGGLLWGTAALCKLVGTALIAWHPPPQPTGPAFETLGQLALIGCLSVVTIAIYEHQQGVIQRVRRARDRADSAVSVLNRLSRYVAPTVFAAIRTSRLDNSLTAASRELTVFFSDIEGFTEMTERLPVGLATRLLNEYLDVVNAMAEKHGGIVDKFMGDGVLIFFDDDRHRGTGAEACACVRMAIEMREEVALLRDVWRAEGTGADLHVRMGIHTGICRVGNFGSAARMDYTVIGAPVNLASRLESAADSDQILISAATKVHVAEWADVRARGRLSLKGIRDPVAVFAVLGARPDGPRHGGTLPHGRRQADASQDTSLHGRTFHVDPPQGDALLGGRFHGDSQRDTLHGSTFHGDSPHGDTLHGGTLHRGTLHGGMRQDSTPAERAGRDGEFYDTAFPDGTLQGSAPPDRALQNDPLPKGPAPHGEFHVAIDGTLLDGAVRGGDFDRSNLCHGSRSDGLSPQAGTIRDDESDKRAPQRHDVAQSEAFHRGAFTADGDDLRSSGWAETDALHNPTPGKDQPRAHDQRPNPTGRRRRTRRAPRRRPRDDGSKLLCVV